MPERNVIRNEKFIPYDKKRRFPPPSDTRSKSEISMKNIEEISEDTFHTFLVKTLRILKINCHE